MGGGSSTPAAKYEANENGGEDGGVKTNNGSGSQSVPVPKSYVNSYLEKLSGGVAGGVNPCNLLELCNELKTASFRGPREEKTVFLRRGCTLRFNVEVSAAKKASFGDDISALSSLVKVTNHHYDEIDDWACSIDGITSGDADGKISIRLKIPVNAAFSKYSFTFVIENKEKEAKEELECPYSFVILYNPFDQQDSVFLKTSDDTREEEIFDKVEAIHGAIITGTQQIKVKRFWSYAQNDPATLHVCLQLTKGTTAEQRSAPKELVELLLTRIGNSLLNFLGSLGLKENQRKIKLDTLSGSDEVFNELGFISYLEANLSNENLFVKPINSEGVHQQIEQTQILVGSLIGLLRFLGVPCHPVTLFNVAHDGQPVPKSYLEKEDNVSYASAKGIPRLRLFDIFAEILLSNAWHSVIFKIEKEGILSPFFSKLNEVSEKIAPLVNPVLEIQHFGVEGTHKICQQSTAWSCRGIDTEIIERTKDYVKQQVEVVEEEDGLNFYVKGGGFIGEELTLVLEAHFQEDVEIEFNITACAQSVPGTLLKQIRSFSGTKKGPFRIERTLEMDDYISTINTCTPLLECICAAKITSKGKTSPLVLYEVVGLIPSSLMLQLKKARDTPGNCTLRIQVTNAAKQQTPEIKLEGMQEINCEETKNALSYTAVIQPLECAMEQITQFKTNLRSINQKLLEENKLPWIFGWFDLKLSVFGLKTVRSQRLSVVALDMNPASLFPQANKRRSSIRIPG